MNDSKEMKKNYTFIDLFSGAGGMSTGFEMAGFKSVLAIDNWQDSLDTYLHNHPGSNTLCADLSNIDIDKVAKAVEDKIVKTIRNRVSVSINKGV